MGGSTRRYTRTGATVTMRTSSMRRRISHRTGPRGLRLSADVFDQRGSGPSLMPRSRRDHREREMPAAEPRNPPPGERRHDDTEKIDDEDRAQRGRRQPERRSRQMEIDIGEDRDE